MLLMPIIIHWKTISMHKSLQRRFSSKKAQHHPAEQLQDTSYISLIISNFAQEAEVTAH